MRSGLLPVTARDVQHPRHSSAYSNVFPYVLPGRCDVAWSFLVLLGVFVSSGVVACATATSASLVMFILSGWLCSLALHEFAHAAVAYKGGDLSVREQGYLSLDLFRYIDPIMTFAVPTVFLFLGGIALPGGSVLILTSKLHSRKWESLTSLAGPAANFCCGLVLACVLAVYCPLAGAHASQKMLAPSLSLLIYFQIMAMILNLIPLPPLDGWGVLSPWLSDACFLKRWMRNTWHARSICLVTFLVIYVGVRYIPGISFLMSVLTRLFGIQDVYVDQGSAVLHSALAL